MCKDTRATDLINYKVLKSSIITRLRNSCGVTSGGEYLQC